MGRQLCIIHSNQLDGGELWNPNISIVVASNCRCCILLLISNIFHIMFRDVPSISGYSESGSPFYDPITPIPWLGIVAQELSNQGQDDQTIPSFSHLGDLQWTIFHFQWWIKWRWEEAPRWRHTFCAKIQLLRRSQNAWSVKTNMGGSSSKARSLCV